jgi:ATP-binding cassette subfamily B protein
LRLGPKVFKEFGQARKLSVLLWPYARAYKGLLALGVVLTGLYIGFQLAQPWPLKWVIDTISGRHGVSVPPAWIANTQVKIAVLSGLYVLFAILGGLAEYGQNLLLAGIGNRVLARFRLDLFSHVLKQSLAYHERRDIGELLTRIVYDTSRLRQGVRNILTRSIQTILLFVFKVAVMFLIDVRLALILALAGLVALLLMRKPSRSIFKASRKQRRNEGRLASVVGENLAGIREFQTFSPGEVLDERFTRRNAQSLKSEQKVRRLAAGLLFRTEVLLAASICLILWIGGQAVQKGQLSAGDLVLFFSYASGLFDPFRRFARQAATTGKTLACGDRLIKIMQKEPVIKDPPEAVDLSGLRGDISFENVTYKNKSRKRGGRKSILKDVSFKLVAGERMAVLGPNGAGKSTLLRLLLRFADPHEGRVVLDGRDIREYSLASLRGQMSVVFQESVFFGISVGENIALGRTEATLEEIQDAANRAQISGLIEKLPLGYDTLVHRQGGLFSGGEKQKIAISRAILRKGGAWLLDEPTSALDAEASGTLMKILLEATEKQTTLWVTHDVRVLSQIDKVLFLDKGRVLFLGTPDDFRAWLCQGTARPEDPITMEYLENLK